MTVSTAAGNRLELRRLIEERLKDSRPPTDPLLAVPAGFSAEVDAAVRQYFPASPSAAAVLVPLVDHEDGLTVLLTQRATHLKNHAGQISFPGGRIEASDEGPLAAALRETEEEIGFWVAPVVGFVQPGFALSVDRSEVDVTFEVPLLHILDVANHKARERMLGTTKVRVYDIPYGEHHIWGATAGMLISLYRLLK